MAHFTSRSNLTVLASALVVAYAAAIAAYLLTLLQPVSEAELGTIDWRFLFRGPQGDKPAEIALVTVDEAAELPYWAPVPREHLARVIQSLSQGGAKLIGVDFYLGSKTFDAEGDSLLREAIIEAGNVIPVSFLERDEDGDLKEYLAQPFFLDGALDYGYATFFTETGAEFVREGRVAIGIDGKHALALAGALYAHARGLDTAKIRALESSRRHEGLPGSDDDYRRVINYNGPPFQYYRQLDREMPGGIAAFHSHQVASLPPMLAQKFFKDRIVLIGAGLSDSPDIYRTPFFSQQYNFERTFGVEIHAQFLHTMLSTKPLEKTGFFASAALVLFAALLGGLASVRLRPYMAFPLSLIVIVLIWILGFYLFEHDQVVIPLVMPTMAVGLACLFGLIYVGSTDGKRKSEVRDRFAPMVDEHQLQEILDTPDAWLVEGDERLVTVLWLELELPESVRHSARETMTFLQDYWQRVSTLIFKYDGAVFLYEESTLGAVFGAPLARKDHAQQAVLAGIDIAEAWLGLRSAKENAPGRLCAGLESGTAFVGELGAGERFTYRVLGKPVERARALAAAQNGDGQVRISKHLQEQVAAYIETTALDGSSEEGSFRVVGRTSAPPIGAADVPHNPFWKYLGLGRSEKDLISEELLSQLALFSGFNRQDLRHIRPLLYHRKYRPGERIFSQGEVGSGMYILQRGSVDIIHEDEDEGTSQLLQRLTEGDFFGELALLSDVLRSATAIAYEKSEILVLFQADLFDMIERQPELGVRLIRALSRITGERLIQVNEELVRREH